MPVVLTQRNCHLVLSVPTAGKLGQVLGMRISFSGRKFKFFARIIGSGILLILFYPDPCDPAIAENAIPGSKQLEFIKLHTEFYSS